ncbi:Ankyrin repeat and LEM domain-containing protein 1 [Portunus trituberculatus]|uniref:Ankyrin repeat and LEM domain-containing protein 1 n=1 Tax=Portunus trituberculatus TaxID=210409 RepID=A0A5B7EMC5_PORTR|nr:Ankyrin repeat and LEM domain-containing protein 1 [Portunus trituberculatus]
MEAWQAGRVEEWVRACNTRCLERTISKENADAFIKRDGTTALHLAAALPKETDSLATATFLLSRGANPNVPNSQGKTSMHIAAFMGHTDLLHLLLLNGGDPLLGDRRGYSPVDWAFHGHHHNTLNFLNNLLDTEELNYDKDDPKYTLSFMQMTVMDVASFVTACTMDSTSSFYSCVSNIQNRDDAETSLGTLIANFNKPTKTDKPPAWFSNHPFLMSLKQEVEMYQEDSDSENDLWTFQCCLGKKLYQEELSSVESEELNVALLTINVSSNTVHDAADKSDASNEHQSLEEQSLHSESCCHDCSNFDVRNNALSSETKVNQSQFYKSFCNEKDRTELCSGQGDDDVTVENSYKPELCTTLHLLKCPKKRERFTNILHETPLSLRKELFKNYCDFELSTSSIGNNLESFKKLEKELIHQDAMSCSTSPVSSHKSTNSRPVQSLISTCPSLLSIAEEFLYKDTEAGIHFIERRCPTVAVLSSFGGTSGVSNRPGNSLKEGLEELASNKSMDSIGPITDTVKAMNAETLRDNLKKLGFEAGPITPSTHTVYMRHLLRLRRKPCHVQKDQSLPPKYCRDLSLLLRQPSSVPWEAWTAIEEEMSLPFSRPDPTRHWRDGTSKSCFNYLLLDPRITQNLPMMGPAMNEREKLDCFVASIFYVGKGSRNRPYYHLYDAMKKQRSCKKKVRHNQVIRIMATVVQWNHAYFGIRGVSKRTGSNPVHGPSNRKIEKIQEIWADDLGVVSLHVFQNTIPVEAWTREAAMIAALGLKNLSNSVQGTFYGPASTWTNSKRQQLGTHLLYRSFNIFLQEGERQLRPCDIALPFTPART